MSKSLKRVIRHADELGLGIKVIQMTTPTKTAQQAADAVACHVDQIAKSIIFLGCDSNTPILFLTAGGNRVCANKASQIAKEPLGKADASFIRATTGFAIGGVSPIGHLNPIRCFVDPRLLAFETVWAAAGTPNHLFSINAEKLLAATQGVTSDFCE
ncbi:MAG: YbaK/EbsC family protein [Amylibacter sp.]|nr:YbaK/EbsC family protein [Amylibacter sp.]